MVVLVLFGQMETPQKDFVEEMIVKGNMENILGGQNVAIGMAILVNQNLLWVNMLVNCIHGPPYNPNMNALFFH